MSDNSTRWQRVVSQSGDKPRFKARQTTDDILPPTRRRTRTRSGESVRLTDRTTLWWMLAVLALTAIAGMLTWLVFFT